MARRQVRWRDSNNRKLSEIGSYDKRLTTIALAGPSNLVLEQHLNAAVEGAKR